MQSQFDGNRWWDLVEGSGSQAFDLEDSADPRLPSLVFFPWLP